MAKKFRMNSFFIFDFQKERKIKKGKSKIYRGVVNPDFQKIYSGTNISGDKNKIA